MPFASDIKQKGWDCGYEARSHLPQTPPSVRKDSQVTIERFLGIADSAFLISRKPIRAPVKHCHMTENVLLGNSDACEYSTAQLCICTHILLMVCITKTTLSCHQM